ncbi:MAG: AAA family ATPase [Thermoanaerobaculaceae bacterium]
MRHWRGRGWPAAGNGATATTDWITIRNAREHNLKGIDLRLPRQALIVVTGVSGSGKSSLVVDTIAREAQRRYFETFSSHARQAVGRMGAAAVDEVAGLGPAVLVDQRTVVRSPRSTVGTLSELGDLLRLLFARLGLPREVAGRRLRRSLFSFNSPEGACPACDGLGVQDRLDPALLVADATRSIRGRALAVTTPNGYLMYSQVTLAVLDQVCRAHGFDIDTPWRELTDEQRRVVLHGSDAITVPYGKHPLESRLRWSGITPRPRQEGTYKGIVPVMEGILRRERNPSVLRFCRRSTCEACGGTRLRPETLEVRVHGRTIAELSALELAELDGWLAGLAWSPAETPVGEPIVRELRSRTALYRELGLGHLALDRASASLSGGEAQRLRLGSLATADLRNLLVVLDEPTVGVHPRDVGRLLGVLRRLRDGGNTVLVVEHDPQVWAAADWLVELGPGAGVQGGWVVRSEARGARGAEGDGGHAEGLGSGVRGPGSEGQEMEAQAGAEAGGAGWLGVGGLTRNNLKGVEITLAAGRLNVVTGVSGAGKSSLVEEVAERAGRGEVAGAPPRVVVVDADPIGRTSRSNPATYSGAAEHIRDLFARQPAAKAAGLGTSAFSFNVPGGRCEACEGAGAEEVGMHFLGTVEVPCDVCGGRRFHADTLAVTWRGASIADVLAMPVAEAARFFASEPRLARILGLLDELGLGYLGLGQPSPTLSGGEAQRLKLATELARGDGRPALFLLDEPTVGLHPQDVRVLLRALDRLCAAGHTVLVVEHDLDVVRAACHVVDLGPEGGTGGGRVVAEGPPAAVAACERSHTGAALRALAAGTLWRPVADAPRPAPAPVPIELRGVWTHNLAGIDVTVPAGALTVVTGVSGSGKSSLAFDTLHGEARARFLACLPTALRLAAGPLGEAELDGASGLTPTVAVRQHRPSRNPRSTVGTLTGTAELVRLLLARAGTRRCPDCGSPLADGSCPACAFAGLPELWSTHFSPANQHTACTACHGLGAVRRCDPGRLVTHPDRPLGAGAMDGTRAGCFFGEPDGQHVAALLAASRVLGLDLARPWAELDDRARAVAMRGAGELELDVEWHYRRGKRAGTHRFSGRWIGFASLVEQEYARVHAGARGEALEPLLVEERCAACGGGGLGPELLAVRFAGKGIAEALAMPAAELDRWMAEVVAGPEAHDVGPRAAMVSREVQAALARRLGRLTAVGLGYLSLDRRAATLSGGEAQRVGLAALPDLGLVGLTCVLDEPTAGLHPRDTARLLELLRSLRDSGNTLVVVEHDLAVIGAADHVLELGPGGGAEGGRLVGASPPAALAADPASATGRYLAQQARPPRRPRPLRPGVTIRGARANTLQDLDVAIPAGGLVAVTGVSGSGKSSLVLEVLAASLAGFPHVQPVGCAAVELAEPFTGVLAAGQGRLATSPHSSPGSLTGVLDHLRDRLARTPEARAARLAPGAFSTAAAGGRCEACEGWGRVRVSMDFLPDVWVACETCQGARFRPEVLACRLGGRTIAELLDGTLAETVAVFAGEPAVSHPLAPLVELGLGYLRLGQPTTTLSGGERQRLELALALAAADGGPRLVLLDEPTRGLHPADVERLLRVFDRLVEAGHSLVVVEHDLAVVAAADHVIDLGPEGGAGGGRLVAAGRPDEVAACEASHTGRALRARAAWAS